MATAPRVRFNLKTATLSQLSLARRRAVRLILFDNRGWNPIMTIRKQEFYEGAALHQLIRGGRITSIKYQPPLFTVNNELLICLKYSTKGRSPWGFTFTVDERRLLRTRAKNRRLVIGLICGADGIVAISYEDYRAIAGRKRSAIHISCYRKHGQHYGVFGPEGELNRKIAPSFWQRILED